MFAKSPLAVDKHHLKCLWLSSLLWGEGLVLDDFWDSKTFSLYQTTLTVHAQGYKKNLILDEI